MLGSQFSWLNIGIQCHLRCLRVSRRAFSLPCQMGMGFLEVCCHICLADSVKVSRIPWVSNGAKCLCLGN